MLGCTETMTLIQRHYDSDTDMDVYTQTVITGVSWYGKVKIEVQDKGVRSASIIQVRIPEENLPAEVALANGDYIVKGELAKKVTKQSDLTGVECYSIISIGDNRRGNLRHWAVTAV